MHARYFSRINLIAYRDEPSASATQDQQQVLAYAQQSAHLNGISFYIATDAPGTPGLWYYQYADFLLITRYDVGAHKDNNPSTTSDRWMDWDAKRNDYASIQSASGKPISPIVAAHNWDSSAYGGYNDWGWPSQDEIKRYVKCITTYFSSNMCWFYCGDDGTENLWVLPQSSPQINKIYTAVESWPYTTLNCSSP